MTNRIENYLNLFYLYNVKSPSLPGVKSQPKRCDAARGSARWLAPYLQDARLILRERGEATDCNAVKAFAEAQRIIKLSRKNIVSQ